VQEWQLFEIFQRKAVPELEQFLAQQVRDVEVRAMLRALVSLAGDRNVIARARQQLSAAPKAVVQALAELEQIADQLTQSHPSVNLYFDLGELRGYHYHTGPVFSAYVPGMGQAIANGGRYDHIGEVFGRARPATGFSTDLAELMRRSADPIIPDRIFAPAHADAGLQAQVRALRAAGEIVIQALDDAQTPQSEGCTRQLLQGANGWAVSTVSTS